MAKKSGGKWNTKNAASVGEAEKAAAYQYKDCGLDYIWLLNGFEIINDPVFGKGVSIHNLEGLGKAIAEGIVLKAPFMRGQEIRFLRSQLKLNQTEMGTLVGRDMRTIQRWEEKKNESIPTDIDRFLRLFCTAYLGKEKTIAHQVCEYIKEAHGEIEPAKVTKDAQFPRVELVDTGTGWKAAA